MDSEARSKENPASEPIDFHDPRVAASLRRYWRANMRITVLLLILWAFAGLGCGVVFADVLNRFHIGGFPLGFWFAQQGSIVVFVVIIFAYAVLMNRLDRKHHEELEEIRRSQVSR